MRRSTIVAFVVLGAALAGFAFSSTFERLRGKDDPAGTSAPAGPQSAALNWRETYGPPGERLIFEVERLDVLRNGWRARLGLVNNTAVAWDIGDPRATLDRSFGLMLFATGDAVELEQRNKAQTLPPVRPAIRYDPELPEILEPGASWRGEIFARGSLGAGSWVRVVFGTLIAVGRVPDGFEESLVWITDHTYRLRR